MTLRSRLQHRLRPWHAVMLAVFLAGAAFSLRDGDYAPFRVLAAVVAGLFTLVLFQFTVGNLWAYAVEYHNAGGSWTDAPFLAPFAAGGGAGAVTLFYTDSLGAAAWAAFWTFAVVAAVVAGAAWFLAGYRDSAA
ncbi:hypothetical protein [Halogeometricum limi]|uniref:Uncharacterized protein n=1 Tax=Halogeometricum limi TaxID=555875 RepID=A0A1I6HLB0_9EURY|nr:hypothetical protein [Halogeometricum limi]SFR55070.1 hypothetical protein SAMN04488124_2352 [Halogeometricum limi]